MKKLYTADRATGTFIEEVSTIKEGLELIADYEIQDKINDVFEADFYDVVDENHRTMTQTVYAALAFINGDIFVELFADKDEAISNADREWRHLCEYDKNKRESFYVAEGNIDSDGEFDFDSAITVKIYK